MILYFNYEELRALKAGAQTLLEGESGNCGSVLAPPQSRAQVEALVPRLEGDLSLPTLSELRAVAAAVDVIVACLRVEMEVTVLATHAADESAVAAYFDYAHALTVSRRLADMATEMEALIEVVTGERVTAAAAADFRFPD